MIKIGIMGFGYWGSKLVKELTKHSGIAIHSISDLNQTALENAKHLFPKTICTANYKEILNNQEIDAVFIATPIHTHYSLVKESLEANKHVLVEKPLSNHVNEVLELCKIAKQKNLVLMTDFTPLYSSAGQELQKLITNNLLGKVSYFISHRTNFGCNDLNCGVISDLAVHDLALMTYLIQSNPTAVSAISGNFLKKHIPSMAFLTFYFEDDTLAHIYVNSTSPEKIRKVVIGGEKCAVYNDCLEEGKLRLYEYGMDHILNSFPLTNLDGLSKTIEVGNNDAIYLMQKHFIDCIVQGKKPITNIDFSLKITQLIEATVNSIKNQGEITKIDYSKE